jgi:F-type H+-transporting ATPase subunit b
MHLFPVPVLVVVQLAPFLVLMVGLHFLLFKPMIAFLDERRAATVGARAEAERLQSQAGDQVGRYEAALAAARGTIAELRGARRAEANAAYQAAVSAARSEADAQVAVAVDRIRAETKSARAELGGAARVLADDVAAKVLGRPVSSVEA